MSKDKSLDLPYPPSSLNQSKVRVGKLDTIDSLRREAARLYRSARLSLGNDVDPSSATKLAYILSSIGRMIEGADFERRIQELERQVRDK